MPNIKWNKDYEELFNNEKCPHCTGYDFDADSCQTAVENYIDLFFVRKKDKIKFISTDKEWNYAIQKQIGSSNKYEIIISDNIGHEVCMRGDTIGTYKTILKAKIVNKQQPLTYSYLKQIDGLNIEEYNFCNCKNNSLYNNYTIGSFFIIPKPKTPRASLNTSRAISPYYDNIFIFLKLIEDYKNDTITDSIFLSLFNETKDFWNTITFEQYIESMGLNSFVKDIPEILYTSPYVWNIETINLYNKTLNTCIEKRNKLLYNRLNDY